MLILGDFKSLFPEVFILVDFKQFIMSTLQKYDKFVEVLILVDFKFLGMSEIDKIEIFVEVLILEWLGRTNCKNGWI